MREYSSLGPIPYPPPVTFSSCTLRNWTDLIHIFFLILPASFRAIGTGPILWRTVTSRVSSTSSATSSITVFTWRKSPIGMPWCYESNFVNTLTLNNLCLAFLVRKICRRVYPADVQRPSGSQSWAPHPRASLKLSDRFLRHCPCPADLLGLESASTEESPDVFVIFVSVLMDCLVL